MKIPIIKILFRSSFIIYLSFNLVLMVWPLIELPFSNPYHIEGPLAHIQFNPLNNILRIALVILGLPVLYYLLSFLIKKNDFYLRLLTSIVFTLVFLSAQFVYFTSSFPQLDMFHHGQQLGPASDILLYNKKPFTDIFFYRGLFEEPLSAILSFQLFGFSIGSFFLFSSLLQVLGVFCLYSILSLVISDEVIYIFASLFLKSSILLPNFERRDFFFYAVLLLFIILVKKLSLKITMLITGFLSVLLTLISLDRGVYMISFTVLIAVLSSILQFFQAKNSAIKVKNVVINLFIPIIYSLGGIFLGFIVILVLLDISAFKEYIISSFIIIPRIKGLFDEYIYPAFNLNNVFPYWILLFMIVASVFAIKDIVEKYFLKIKKERYDYFNEMFFIFIFFVLSLLFLKTIIGRSDYTHIFQSVYPLFICMFLIVNFYFIHNSQLIIKVVIILLLTALFLSQFTYKEALTYFPDYQLNDVKAYFSLPKFADNLRITKEQFQVSQYIEQHTTTYDPIFVFDNEAAYYYLTQRKNPTRFYLIYFASTDDYQHEVIRSLERQLPKYIIYSSDNWTDHIDGIYNRARLPMINNWILKNYPKRAKIGSTVILKQ